MLIRYRDKNKFIFVANTKTASTSIEKTCLFDLSDIRITNTKVGKHMSISTIKKRFDYIFKVEEFHWSKFFKFGVIRDPLSWVVSWYKFRCRKELLNSPNYAGNMDFSEWWNINKGKPFLKPQCHQFLDSKQSKIIVDLIINYEDLEIDMDIVRDKLGLDYFDLPKSNSSKASNSNFDSVSVSDIVREEIQIIYLDDYELVNKNKKN